MTTTNRPVNTEVAAADEPFTIFINYRRSDEAGYARNLSDRLRSEFGEDAVYFDVDQEPGIRWLNQILTRGLHSGVFLSLVGPHWMSALSAPRPEGSTDYVRREIELALQEWPGVVIPVLIDVQAPPWEKLPRSIRGLFSRQALELRHASYDRDVSNLLQRLRDVRDQRRTGSAAAAQREVNRPKVARPATTDPPPAGVPAPGAEHYRDVIAAMADGVVVPLLGSSVRGALPDSRHLARRLAERFGIAAGSGDLAEIAQQVAVMKTENQLYTAMKELLTAQAEPTDVHTFLARFPGHMRRLGLVPRYQLIITTNYDWALERAFEDVNEPFDLALYMAKDAQFVHLPWDDQASAPTIKPIADPSDYHELPIEDDFELSRTIIVKLHGAADGDVVTFRSPNNYVVTEDHYIDYLPSNLPAQVRAKLIASRCLFLGYRLTDWNARVLLRRIWRGASLRENSWAIEHQPDVLEKASWGAVGRVELLASALPQYGAALRATLENWSFDERADNDW